MTLDQIETFAERIETARDLQAEARQMLGAASERQEWEIVDASPRRQMARLYSTLDGQPVEVFDFQVQDALARRVNGRPMFTAHRDRAPQYVPGKVKCFLHPEAEEAELLREIGIFGDCTANELKTLHAKREHGRHKHPQAWAAYQEHLAVSREESAREERRQQLDATLEIARGRGRKAAE